MVAASWARYGRGGKRPPLDPGPSGPRGARALKRILDVTVAAWGLLLLAPALALIAIVIRLAMGAPVLFHQRRPGLHGRPFTIHKFRTMRQPGPDESMYHTDAQRLTRLGRFLRTTSLDELPELWNVLRGDMSLVGPRPLLMEYLDDYGPNEARRHDVRPGITGWAVINGRSEIGFRERLALDVWYVDHWSVTMDLRILARTASQVLRRSGALPTQPLGLGFPIRPDEGPRGPIDGGQLRPRVVPQDSNHPERQ